MENGGESYFRGSGKVFELRLLHSVTCEDPAGVSIARVKGLELGKLKEQKESQGGWRPVKEGEGGKKERRQDSCQGCLYKEWRWI